MSESLEQCVPVLPRATLDGGPLVTLGHVDQLGRHQCSGPVATRKGRAGGDTCADPVSLVPQLFEIANSDGPQVRRHRVNGAAPITESAHEHVPFLAGKVHSDEVIVVHIGTFAQCPTLQSLRPLIGMTIRIAA